MKKNKWCICTAVDFTIFIVAVITIASSLFAGEVPVQPPAEHVPPPIRRPEPELSVSEQKIPDWQARWELARVLSYAKHYKESIVEYKKLLESKPDLTAAKLELGQVLYWDGKHDESFELIQNIDQEKLDNTSLLLLADLYVVRKDYDNAEKIYRTCLNENPKNREVWCKLADMLSWQKKYEESLDIFAKLVKESPDDIQLRRKYAYVLIWDGQHEKGAEELKKTLDRSKKTSVQEE